MIPSRQRLALFGVALVASLALAACGSDDPDPTSTPPDGGNGTATATATRQPSGDLTPATLMLNWTPNAHHAGIYLAQTNGWYEEAGIDLEIVEPAVAGADQVVGSGGAEFGISQAESLLPARAAGVPVVSIGTILPYNDSSFMMLDSSGITRPRDFEGATYGGYGGALETELLRTLVSCDGGDPDLVQMVEVGNIDYLAGMEQGRFDIVWVFEGWDALRAREVEGREVRTVPFVEWLDCIPDWYTPIFIASERLIADDPDLVRAATEYHAPQFVGEEPWASQDGEIWATFEAFLRTAGLLQEQVDVDEAFTNEFIAGAP